LSHIDFNFVRRCLDVPGDVGTSFLHQVVGPHALETGHLIHYDTHTEMDLNISCDSCAFYCTFLWYDCVGCICATI